MIVQIVSGSWPPQRCGVGDYAAMLASSLEAEGVGVLRTGDQEIPLGSSTAGRAATIMRRSAADVIHVQYPTFGFGRSVMPPLLPLLVRNKPFVVTLHEFSIFRFYRWPWFATYAYKADAIVFTSAFEEATFHKRYPKARAQTLIIPIGSNIPEGPDLPRTSRSVCYFGLIMQGKGVEQFLRFARIVKAADPTYAISLIGAIPVGAEQFAASLLDEARGLCITLHIALAPDEVAAILKQTGFAYLPFPDAATERRGSLLASMLNGVRVIAPTGPQTPDWLRAAILDAASPEAAAAALLATTTALPPETPPQTMSWTAIANRHKSLYDSLIAAHPARKAA